MKISTSFDSGAVIIDDVESNFANLRIRADAEHAGSPFTQWFHFRAYDLSLTEKSSFCLSNAAKTAYPGGWVNYTVCASYDRDNWFRIADTTYGEDGLKWNFQAEHKSCFFAYFPPYSREQKLDFISKAQLHKSCLLSSVGNTVDGDTLDVLCISTNPSLAEQRLHHDKIEKPDKKKMLWIICRQHPGETQASFWAEGFVNRLLDDHDPKSRSIIEKADIYVIPNMNPDGSRRGYLRVNAAGKNLNREWQSGTKEDAPEVFFTKEAIAKTGVDFFLDCHSEEELEYVFISKTCLGVPSHTARQQFLYDKYVESLKAANPEFQSEFGYKMPQPGSANLDISVAYIAETYGCLACTQEQPFKDNVLYPQPECGWSKTRCSYLGKSAIDAIHAVIDDLRETV